MIYFILLFFFKGSTSSASESTIGPTLPQTVKTSRDSDIGPQLPPDLALHASDSEFDEDEEEGISIGPTMPKHVRTHRQQESSDEDSYGPRLLPRQSHRTLSDNDEDYGPKLPSSNLSKAEDDDDSYGPKLPPSTSSSKQTKLTAGKDDDDDSYGPKLPPTCSSSSSKQTKLSAQDDDDDDSYGPKLPPTTLSKQTLEDDGSYGPSLPPSSIGHKSQVKGPSLPANLPSHGEEDDEDDEMIGPLPWMMHKPSDTGGGQSAVEEFEARSRAMKNKLTGKVISPKGPLQNSTGRSVQLRAVASNALHINYYFCS